MSIWCLITFSILSAILFVDPSSGEVLNTGAELQDALVDPDVADDGINALSFVFLLIPLVFIGGGLFGLYASVKQFFGPAKQVYGLTNERLIIMDRFWSSRVASLSGAELHKVERRGNDRVGTLQFGPPLTIYNMGMSDRVPLNSLLKIQNPRDLETLIRKQFRNKGYPHE